MIRSAKGLRSEEERPREALILPYILSPIYYRARKWESKICTVWVGYWMIISSAEYVQK